MNEIVSELDKVSADVQKTFGNLSAAQINWKSSAESWSIGQCLEHLIKSNELYFNDFDLIAAGQRQNSFLENYSPLSGFFGNLIADSLKKDARKSKTIPQAVPPSKIDENIVSAFQNHQTKLADKIEKMKSADWRKIKLTSPFLKIATYSLADTFRIILEHEKRHFRQAERVMQNQNFPK